MMNHEDDLQDAYQAKRAASEAYMNALLDHIRGIRSTSTEELLGLSASAKTAHEHFMKVAATVSKLG